MPEEIIITDDNKNLFIKKLVYEEDIEVEHFEDGEKYELISKFSCGCRVVYPMVDMSCICRIYRCNYHIMSDSFPTPVPDEKRNAMFKSL